ncbi:MAG: tetratricopeptide repeat protein [Flavobacteriales bacterium]
MRKYLIILCLLPAMLIAGSKGPAEQLFEQGVKSYTNGDYQQAAAQWMEINQAYSLSSPELFFNLGNAYFKLTDYPSAILFYERAIKLDPSYEDAIYNLNVANMRITDKIEPLPELFYQTWFKSIVNLFNANQWSILFLITLLVATAMFALYIFSNTMRLRKNGFYGGVALFVLATLFFYFGSEKHRKSEVEKNAIVFIARSPVKSSPSEMGTDLFFIHAGTKVLIVDQIGNWVKIKIPDGNQGWVESEHLEKI